MAGRSGCFTPPRRQSPPIYIGGWPERTHNSGPMDLTGFTEQQKQVLMDLLVLGMYQDGNLASVEDKRIGELLDTIEFPSDDARDRFADASFTRIRQCGSSPEAVRSFVSRIAKNFDTPDLRRRAFNLLESLLQSDNSVAEQEKRLLDVVREEFKLRPGSGR